MVCVFVVFVLMVGGCDMGGGSVGGCDMRGGSVSGFDMGGDGRRSVGGCGGCKRRGDNNSVGGGCRSGDVGSHSVVLVGYYRGGAAGDSDSRGGGAGDASSVGGCYMGGGSVGGFGMVVV